MTAQREKEAVEHTETSPLLAEASQTPIPLEGGNIPPVPTRGPEAVEGDQEQDEDDDDDTPLPRNQILLLCCARMIDSITFFGIFPFVNSMIEGTGIPEAEVGFYSGLIESIFSLVQSAVMIFWGRLADTHGRKPGLVVSMVGVSIATMLFGFSKNLWQMIVFRSLAGAFAGSIVTVRTMVAENSTKKTQAAAFGYFQFAGNFGIFAGPLLGGLFSNPAKQYPSVFKGIKFFESNPYALATFILGAFGLFVATLNTRTDSSGKRLDPMSIREILKKPGVAIVLFIFCHIFLLGHTYTAILPLFWFTSVPLGGCGLSERWIAIFMGLAGAGQAMWMILAFPFLQRRFGTGAVLRGCAIVWPFFFAIWPFCNFLLRNGLETFFWILAPANDFFGVGVSMAFAAVQLALNDISPSPNTLGMLNAIALTVTTALRAIAPGGMTAIYALGAEHQILWGYLAWLVNIVLAISSFIAVLTLPKKAEGRAGMKAKAKGNGDERTTTTNGHVDEGGEEGRAA